MSSTLEIPIMFFRYFINCFRSSKFKNELYMFRICRMSNIRKYFIQDFEFVISMQIQKCFDPFLKEDENKICLKKCFIRKNFYENILKDECLSTIKMTLLTYKWNKHALCGGFFFLG